MITMIKVYRIKNLEDELKELETKFLRYKKPTRLELRELEQLAVEIAMLKLDIGKED